MTMEILTKSLACRFDSRHTRRYIYLSLFRRHAGYRPCPSNRRKLLNQRPSSIFASFAYPVVTRRYRRNAKPVRLPFINSGYGKFRFTKILLLQGLLYQSFLDSDASTQHLIRPVSQKLLVTLSDPAPQFINPHTASAFHRVSLPPLA